MIEGLNYIPNYFDKEDNDWLLIEVDARPWSNELKRRVQHYGYKYDYKLRKIGKESYLGPLPEFAQRVAAGLEVLELIQKMPDQLIVNEYMPGQGISRHIDCVPCFKDTIVTISLGWAYEIEFNNLKTKETYRQMLEIGSILIISGEARYKWTHEIRARKDDNGIPRQRRVSLTFRNVIL